MTDLARKFRSGSGRKTTWQKSTVYSVYELAVKPGDVIIVERVSSSKTRAQALHLALDKGNLRANGVLMKTAAVWSHTAPEVAELEVVGKRARLVDIWNGWSFEGVESAWLGNGALMVEDNNDVVRFRCSDGIGEPSFDDLVVDVRIEHRG